MKKIWSSFVANFFRGLVFIAPVAITALLISILLRWVRSNFPDAIGPFWGLGIVLGAFFSIAIIGFVGTRFIGKPIAQFAEKILSKIPVVNTIYSSSKDMVNSFFGDNKKFDKPVLVLFDKEGGLEKLGFITQQSLSGLGLEDRVAVYFPLSYSVAGSVFIVNKDRIKVLNISSSDAMRFLISGGLTDI